MAYRRVAIVTSERLPEHWRDVESPLIRAELERRGVMSTMRPWHDVTVDWMAEAFVLVRSPWDVYWHTDEVEGWFARVGAHPAIGNPVPIMRWTLDKRYLRQLADAGVPVVPTTVLEPGETLPPFERAIVIKPTSSGGALDAARWQPDALEDARAHVAAVHGRGLGVLVQPYVDAIDERGERGLVFIDGRFSHAVTKDAILRVSGIDNRREPHPRVRLYEPEPEEHALAAQALAQVPEADQLIFARVDMVPTDDGPRVLELELLDARLFLDLHPPATEALVAAITARM